MAEFIYQFAWDTEKAVANRAKHGVAFELAATVFRDRTTTNQWEATQRAGTALRLQLSGVEFLDPPFDYEKALAQAAPDSRGTVLVLVSPFFFRDLTSMLNFIS